MSEKRPSMRKAYKIAITFDFGQTVDIFEFIGPSLAAAIRWVAELNEKFPTALIIETVERKW